MDLSRWEPAMNAGKRPLFISFPQWQGAGSRDAIDRSCERLPTLLPVVDWESIAVDQDHSCALSMGIRGREVLLEQLLEARRFLEARAPSHIHVLGGDCSVELAPVAYLNALYDGEVTVVWLDAHPDLSTPDTSITANLHGMVLSTLFGEGDAAFVTALPSLVRPSQVVLAGVRDVDPHEWEALERHRPRWVRCEQLNADPEALVVAVKDVGNKRVFVHFDLDVLDPQQFASIAFPTAGGLDPKQVLAALTHLAAGVEIVGFGITEYFERDARDASYVAEVAGVLSAALASR